MDLTKTERHSAMNETQILSRVDHPNIISYYDNFEEDGVLMIEMEYADGGLVLPSVCVCVCVCCM